MSDEFASADHNHEHNSLTDVLPDGPITTFHLDEETHGYLTGADGEPMSLQTDLTNIRNGIDIEPDAITNTHLADNAVETDQIKNGAVTTDKIGDLQVTAAKLATDSVETAKIKDGNVTAAKLATDAVTTIKILNQNITAIKLAVDSVETTKIKDGAVIASKLATDSVETAKIKNGNVTPVKIQPGADGQVLTTTGSSVVWAAPSNSVGGTYYTQESFLTAHTSLQVSTTYIDGVGSVVTGVSIWPVSTQGSIII